MMVEQIDLERNLTLYMYNNVVKYSGVIAKNKEKK